MTSIRISFCAPSPSRTTCSARSSSSASSLAEKSRSSRGRRCCRPASGSSGAAPARSRTAAPCRRSRCRCRRWCRLKLASTPARSMRVEQIGRDLRVREHEAEHGRHVGRDHAAALGDAADPDLGIADPGGADRRLGERVGGHDAARRLFPSVFAERGVQARQGRGQPLVRQHLADHARGGEEDLLRRAAEQGGGGGGGCGAGVARRRGR